MKVLQAEGSSLVEVGLAKECKVEGKDIVRKEQCSHSLVLRGMREQLRPMEGKKVP